MTSAIGNASCGFTVLDNQPMLIEVIACSVEDAIEAERGGAGRLEIARDMERQGLTPPLSLVREIARAVRIPLRVMVREHDGFTCRNEAELRAMSSAAQAFAEIDGVEALVLGFVRGGQAALEIDHDALLAVLGAAPRLRATFHRAFDALPDPQQALAGLKRHTQIDRVLTGGGSGSWDERCDGLRALAELARPEIEVLPGGGIDLDAARCIAASMRENAVPAAVNELHVGRAVRVPHETWGRVRASLVQELCAAAQ